MVGEKRNNIQRMIDSSDKDDKYFAALILRKSGTKTSKKMLKKIPVRDRIKTYSDICEELGIEELTLEHFSFLPVEQRRYSLALHKISNITKVFNGDWVADFDNSSQKKYYPWFERKSGVWVLTSVRCCLVVSFVPVGCYFADESDARHCANLFKDIYVDYVDHIKG